MLCTDFEWGFPEPPSYAPKLALWKLFLLKFLHIISSIIGRLHLSIDIKHILTLRIPTLD